jgi:hypothetical protein
MKQRSAKTFLYRAQLVNSQQVVGFDILQRKEKSASLVEYARKTDRDPYDGVDSAIKAALYWRSVWTPGMESTLAVLLREHPEGNVLAPGCI